MMGILNSILSSLREQPWLARAKGGQSNVTVTTAELTELLITTQGESSALSYAHDLMGRINDLDDDGLIKFFDHLLTMDIDTKILKQAVSTYQDKPDAESFSAIKKAATPQWQRVFERINACYDGTVCLVRLRAKLRRLIKIHPEFDRLDVTLKSLMLTWFNRGFLILEPINWSTSATILEKIIEYEAVHEIESWDDLRARLEPEDRKCFAYFHPAMPDEPLIFVQVALMTEVPTTIETILSTPRDVTAQDDARVAVFYSISNCQDGLAGISFGNFLIKRVAHDLKRDLPSLGRFVTLSPAPGFRKWLNDHAPDFANSLPYADVTDDPERDEQIITHAAKYFMISDRPDGKPNDPVARFHLGNGAELAAINSFGDKSPKALSQGAGVMVNYEYKLEAVEDRHEDYNKNGTIYASPAIKSRIE